jgi:acid phosphatase
MRYLLFFSAAILCAQTQENLNAVLWMQTAAEYRAAAIQTYKAAEQKLSAALKDRDWTAAVEQQPPFRDLPPAVILDLDETVLDNSMFQARNVASGGAFTDETWGKWVAERRAGLVPGALKFLLAAQAKGVEIFYITNRVCTAAADDPTLQMLKALHIPVRSNRLMCKTSVQDASDKSPRRAKVASYHRVLLLIGDDFNDFFGLGRTRWFMVPNPTYGSWERSAGPDKVKTLRTK